MSQLAEFPLEGGGSVRVEVGPGGGISPAGHRGDLVAIAQRSFQDALDPIRPVAASVLATLKDLAQTPSQVSIEFGVKLAVETGVVVARGTAEANFVVRLEWKRTDGPDGEHGQG